MARINHIYTYKNMSGSVGRGGEKGIVPRPVLDSPEIHHRGSSVPLPEYLDGIMGCGSDAGVSNLDRIAFQVDPDPHIEAADLAILHRHGFPPIGAFGDFDRRVGRVVHRAGVGVMWPHTVSISTRAAVWPVSYMSTWGAV